MNPVKKILTLILMSGFLFSVGFSQADEIRIAVASNFTNTIKLFLNITKRKLDIKLNLSLVLLVSTMPR